MQDSSIKNKTQKKKNPNQNKQQENKMRWTLKKITGIWKEIATQEKINGGDLDLLRISSKEESWRRKKTISLLFSFRVVNGSYIGHAIPICFEGDEREIIPSEVGISVGFNGFWFLRFWVEGKEVAEKQRMRLLSLSVKTHCNYGCIPLSCGKRRAPPQPVNLYFSFRNDHELQDGKDPMPSKFWVWIIKFLLPF